MTAFLSDRSRQIYAEALRRSDFESVVDGS